MKRLTERYNDGQHKGIMVKESYVENSLKTFYEKFGDYPVGEFLDCEEGYLAMHKLAEYEDLEEQGLLLRLPCKVGDTVWFIDRTYDCKNKTFSNFVHNGYVKAIKFSSRPTKITVEYENLMDSGRCKGCDYNIGNIGKTVFLTKAEAEEALAKMKGEEHEDYRKW